MERELSSPHLFVALLLAGAAAVFTMPRDAGAHYLELGKFVLQQLELQGAAEPATADTDIEFPVSP